MGIWGQELLIIPVVDKHKRFRLKLINVRISL